MNKIEFITRLTPFLKMRGFKKIRHYWYYVQNGITYYINVQGSSYDKNDYYLNLGAVSSEVVKSIKPIWGWDVSRRCFVDEKQLNVEFSDFLNFIDPFLEMFSTIDNLTAFVEQQKKVYSPIIISARYKLY